MAKRENTSFTPSKRSIASDALHGRSPSTLGIGPPKLRRLSLYPRSTANVHDLFAPPKELLREPKPRGFKANPWKHAAEKPDSVSLLYKLYWVA